MDEHAVRTRIQAAPSNHALRTSRDDYRDAFVSAFLNVYGHKTDRHATEILKRKLLVSPDSNFSENTYLQGASELSVAHHIKGQAVAGFETDKRINPANNKDVDVSYKLKSVAVCTEVKCAEEADSNEPGALYLRTDGRIPDHNKVYNDLRAKVEAARSDVTLKLGKNKDKCSETIFDRGTFEIQSQFRRGRP